MTRDPHKILGLKPGASHEEIRGAYLRMVKKYHPDAGGDAWVFSEIQAAYDALTNQKPPAGNADPKRGKPTAKSQSRGESPPAQDREQSPKTPSGTASKPSAGAEGDAKPSFDGSRDNSRPQPGATIDEFSFSNLGTGRRPRRRRASAWTTMLCAALGGLMALSLGWYLLQTRPDLIAFLRRVANSAAESADNSADQPAGDSAQNDLKTESNKSPAIPSMRSEQPEGITPKQPPSKAPIPKPNMRERPSRVPNRSKGDSSPMGTEPAGPEPPATNVDSSPALENSDSTGQARPKPADDVDSLKDSDQPAKTDPESTKRDPAQPTGIESLDADILEFDRRLAAAQREPTELKRQTKLDDAVAWMEKNCKRARARIKFQVADIRRGEGEGYVVQLGPPDPGNYPRLMSYPKIAEMNLDEDDALRVGDQFRLEVTGYTGFQWGTLDPSEAIVFYASECPLARVQPGAAYGPNFGAFPTDYFYLAKDSLHPAYWIILEEAQLRIVKAKD